MVHSPVKDQRRLTSDVYEDECFTPVQGAPHPICGPPQDIVYKPLQPKLGNGIAKCQVSF